MLPLKVFASETKGIQNAAMQFDVKRLRPRFELILNQPGRSYALSIAQRIGLPADLLDRAESLLGEESAELESLLKNLEEQRKELQDKLVAAQKARDEAVGEAKILHKQIATLRQQEQKVLDKAAEKAEEMLQTTLKQATNLKRTARTSKKQRGQAIEELQELRRNVKEKVAPKKVKQKKAPQESPYKEGTTVFVDQYSAEGQIVASQGNMLTVQLGLLKVKVPKEQVKPKKQPKQPKPSVSIMSTTDFDTELNIRGQRVEIALEQLRDFLLEARSLKTKSVRVLHGKGTGALREAIREYLKYEPMVENFEDALPYEGGHGVTVAYLRL